MCTKKTNNIVLKKERLVLIFVENRYGSLILLSIMENEIIQSLSEECL